MANILWFSWCGGGNLPPSLGIAKQLKTRGHHVTFAGRPEMADRVKAEGFTPLILCSAYVDLDAYPESPVRRMICYLTSPAVSEEVEKTVATVSPDVVLIDALFLAALSVVPRMGCKTVLACHTFFFRMFKAWQDQVTKLNGFRQQAGFAALPNLEQLWFRVDKAIVTTSLDLDQPSAPLPESFQPSLVHHVGPVLEEEGRALSFALPWEVDDVTPIILVSFSTQPEQRAVDKMQRVLDALSLLPVRVVITTAGTVEPDELRVPPNAILWSYAAHTPIMKHAKLIISHGGHGTAMRALRAAVPLLLMPGLALDQPFIAAACAEWGAGKVLNSDATVDAIRDCVVEILNEPGYASCAAKLAKDLRAANGALAGALEIEQLL